MKLDVGCGCKPKGNVNLDLFPFDIKHREITKKNIPLREVKNFVKGDAHFLPFRNDIFTIVYCIHTLEHLFNPLMALREFKRVSNGKVIVKVPSLLGVSHSDRTKVHLYAWSKASLENLLNIIFDNVKVIRSESYLHRAQAKFLFLRKTIAWIIKLIEKDELTAICLSESKTRIQSREKIIH